MQHIDREDWLGLATGPLDSVCEFHNDRTSLLNVPQQQEQYSGDSSSGHAPDSLLEDSDSACPGGVQASDGSGSGSGHSGSSSPGGVAIGEQQA